MNLIPFPNSPDGRFIEAFPEATNNCQVLVKPDWDIGNQQRLVKTGGRLIKHR